MTFIIISNILIFIFSTRRRKLAKSLVFSYLHSCKKNYEFWFEKLICVYIFTCEKRQQSNFSRQSIENSYLYFSESLFQNYFNFVINDRPIKVFNIFSQQKLLGNTCSHTSFSLVEFHPHTNFSNLLNTEKYFWKYFEMKVKKLCRI